MGPNTFVKKSERQREKMKINRKYVTFVWFTLVVIVGVILWGAFVRATGSGAGCGSHWPLCNGEVLPRAPETETIIEFTHRVTSAFSGLLVLIMLVWSWRAYPRGHVVRKGAGWSMFFMLTEGLVGAGLVLFELVGGNTSMTRAVMAALHLANTFLLVAFVALTGWWAGGGRPFTLRNQGVVGRLVWVGLLLFLLLGASGAVTALGDTLFRPETLTEGWQQKTTEGAHFLVQLRIWHPIIGIVTGVYLIVAGNVINAKRPSPQIRRLVSLLKWLFAIQLGVGVVNVLLLAPVWMQIVHLLLADIVWIAAVLLGAAALAQEEPVAETAVLVPTGD